MSAHDEIKMAEDQAADALDLVKSTLGALSYLVGSQLASEDYDSRAIARASTVASGAIINLRQAERVLVLARKIVGAST